MSVPTETIEEIVRQFREFSPPDLSEQEFLSRDGFFEEFNNFKFPLISFLSERVEEAVRTVPDTITEEFLRGFVDGAMVILGLLADMHLEERK